MPERVVAVIIHGGDILACRGTDDGATVGLPTVASGGQPLEEALTSLARELELSATTVERRADPVETPRGAAVPVLARAEGRDVTSGDPCRGPWWVAPGELWRQDDRRWWRAYAAVAPTVETVAEDAERGSAAIAIDALWVLRDAATVADALDDVAAVASRLLAARPAMAALSNRVNRAMADADAPAAVEAAAGAGIAAAHRSHEAAAALAAETVGTGRVLTLSRSGTVRAALLAARPAVEVLASRPGGEGRDVARELADAGLVVESHPDAAVYDRLRSGAVDAVLVGADALTADGWVVNKVGTRAVGLAARAASVPCYVACTSDKVRPAPADDEGAARPPLERLFDETPPDLVTAVLTERGPLGAEAVRAVAEDHRALAGWRDP